MSDNEEKTFTRYPIIPVRNAVAFPGVSTALTLGRTESIAAMRRSMEKDARVLIVNQRHEVEGIIAQEDLYSVGTVCRLEATGGDSEEGTVQLLAKGEMVVEIHKVFNDQPFLEGETSPYQLIAIEDPTSLDFFKEQIKGLAKDILKLLPVDTKHLVKMLDSISEVATMVNICIEQLSIPGRIKQELLETRDLGHRALRVVEIMQVQKENLEIQNQIRNIIGRRMGENQRDNILREQLKAIQDELDGDDASDKKLEKKLLRCKMPKELLKSAEEDLRRLRAMGPMSMESHLIRNHLELLADLPWGKSKRSKKVSLSEAKDILDFDHYGLEKVKERILQHLAVMELKKSESGSILLLVGPPGVGKTSLGRSIATALDRPFYRISLGGVRDESEIRGHRRTYVGAMPGKIIQAIKKVKSNNPVLLLDEIDKMGRGWTGDPAAALLEVLDPEQNREFTDHFVNGPFDLSKVIFIATANSLEGIPGPLLDRMEVLTIAGYTSDEKLAIAKTKLWPKAVAEHGLGSISPELGIDTLNLLIERYTREAGVRNLQRELSRICRHIAHKQVSSEEKPTQLTIQSEELQNILGPEKFTPDLAEKDLPVGVATGLAWTQSGGDILFIEAQWMHGHGKLTLTGQLGSVMKESAQIALSLARVNLPTWAPTVNFSKVDLHIHIPSGSIPKDGPSAGITLFTALASLLTGKSIPANLAMTGELTLRGQVMPVGGIKEKLLAAHRAGIREILLCSRNFKDLVEVPKEVRDDLRIISVDTASDVLRHALGLEATPAPMLRDRPVEVSVPLPTKGRRSNASRAIIPPC